MEHERRTKMITIVVLVVIAFGLSIGFAVYSKNLNIQNIQASITGGQSNFNVVFSTSSTSASEGTVTGSKYWDAPAGTGGTATLSGTTISNLTAALPSSGGGVEYDFYDILRFVNNKFL